MTGEGQLLSNGKLFNPLFQENDIGIDTAKDVIAYFYCHYGHENEAEEFLKTFQSLTITPINISGNVSLSEYEIKGTVRDLRQVYEQMNFRHLNFWVYEERIPPQPNLETVNVTLPVSDLIMNARKPDGSTFPLQLTADNKLIVVTESGGGGTADEVTVINPNTQPVPVSIQSPSTIPVSIQAPSPVPVAIQSPATIPVNIVNPATIPANVNITSVGAFFTMPIEVTAGNSALTRIEPGSSITINYPSNRSGTRRVFSVQVISGTATMNTSPTFNLKAGDNLTFYYQANLAINSRSPDFECIVECHLEHGEI